MLFVPGSSVQVPKADVKRKTSALESYFIKVADLDHKCFPMGFQENFRNPFLQKNCELLLCFGTKQGRCKYWSSIVLLESGITSEKAKLRFFRKKKGVSFAFKFLLEVSLRYQFRGFMFKEHLLNKKKW